MGKEERHQSTQWNERVRDGCADSTHGPNGGKGAQTGARRQAVGKEGGIEYVRSEKRSFNVVIIFYNMIKQTE